MKSVKMGFGLQTAVLEMRLPDFLIEKANSNEEKVNWCYNLLRCIVQNHQFQESLDALIDSFQKRVEALEAEKHPNLKYRKQELKWLLDFREWLCNFPHILDYVTEPNSTEEGE